MDIYNDSIDSHTLICTTHGRKVSFFIKVRDDDNQFICQYIIIIIIVIDSWNSNSFSGKISMNTPVISFLFTSSHTHISQKCRRKMKKERGGENAFARGKKNYKKINYYDNFIIRKLSSSSPSSSLPPMLCNI